MAFFVRYIVSNGSRANSTRILNLLLVGTAKI